MFPIRYPPMNEQIMQVAKMAKKVSGSIYLVSIKLLNMFFDNTSSLSECSSLSRLNAHRAIPF